MQIILNKINEAFSVLKSPVKRDEYNRKMKIMKMKNQKGFKDFDDKAESGEYSSSMHEDLKKKSSKIREEIDPEFEEELKKHNFDRMFREFADRPMRSQPEEMKVMQPEFIKKLSRRDLARLKFIVKHRENQIVNKSLVNKFKSERLKLLDILGDGAKEGMSYKQLVEEINKNYQQLEGVDNPLIMHKTEQQEIAETIKKQDKQLSKITRVYYPILGIVFIINAMIIIGVYYQHKQSEINNPAIELQENLLNLARSAASPDHNIQIHNRK